MKDEAASWESGHKLLFLPFRKAIETEFLVAAERKVSTFAKEIGRDRSNIEDALEECKGVNYHQRFVHVADRLGFEIETFTNLAMRRWLKNAHRKAAVQGLAREIATSIGVALP